MATSDEQSHERTVLLQSTVVVALYIVLALIFALLTGSSAILFDGIYSVISLFMSFLTLIVARLASRPRDKRFPFGYGVLEPALNLFKSIIIIVSCIYAGVASVQRLLVGGTEADYGLAIYYGLIASVLGFLMDFYLRRQNRHIGSDLIAVESRTWFMDGMLSLAVFAGFISAYVLENSPWAEFAPMMDPIILILLVTFALPLPARIFWNSMKEVLDMAPAAELYDEIEDKLRSHLAHFGFQGMTSQISKQGRTIYVLSQVVVAENDAALTVADMDRIRATCTTELALWNPNIRVDLLFTLDQAD